MAGLLDFLGTDEAKMGLGLLAASGPSTTPMNAFQRIQMAQQGMDAGKQERMRLQLLQSQIDENASQAALRQAQMTKAAELQKMTGGLLGDIGGTSMGGGSNVGVPGNVAAGLRGVPIERIAALKAAGGPDLVEAWKAVNVPTSLAAGSYAFTPGQSPTYMAAPDKGFGIGPQGVYELPGAAAAHAGIEGAKEAAKAAAQARYQEATPTINADGSKSVRSRLEQYGTGNPLTDAVMQTESNGNPNAVSPKGAKGLMQVMPATNTAPGFGVAPAKDDSEPERTRVGQDYLAKMKERYGGNDTLAAIAYNWGPGNADMWLKSGGDYSKLPDETKKYVSAVMTRSAVNGYGPRNVVELSPAQQAANKAAEVTAVETAKAGVTRDTETQKKSKSAGVMIAAADRAIDLLKQGPTASGAGELADKAANFVGKSPKGAQISSQLDIVAGDLVNNVPRMEGPQSNTDMLEYKTQAGRAADRTIPVPQRIAAMEEVKRLQMKYAGLNGGDSEKPKLFDELPKTAPKGKRMRNTETGKVMVFDGLSWKEE